MRTKSGFDIANALVAVADNQLVQIKAWRVFAPTLVRQLALGHRVSIMNVRRVNTTRNFNSGTIDFELQWTSASEIVDLDVEEKTDDASLIKIGDSATTLGRFGEFKLALSLWLYSVKMSTKSLLNFLFISAVEGWISAKAVAVGTICQAAIVDDVYRSLLRFDEAPSQAINVGVRVRLIGIFFNNSIRVSQIAVMDQTPLAAGDARLRAYQRPHRRRTL